MLLPAASPTCYHNSAHVQNSEQVFCLSGADQRDIFFPKRQNLKKRFTYNILLSSCSLGLLSTLTHGTKTQSGTKLGKSKNISYTFWNTEQLLITSKENTRVKPDFLADIYPLFLKGWPLEDDSERAF